MPEHVVDVSVAPALTGRNRLMVAFRPILAIPHLLLVGTPLTFGLTIAWRSSSQPTAQWGATPGVLGAVAGVCALIAWFAIVFGGEYPAGLRSLALYDYAGALALPPTPPCSVTSIRHSATPSIRHRSSSSLPPGRAIGCRRRFESSCSYRSLSPCGFRRPWAITTIIARVMVILTGDFPESLYNFGVGALRWRPRVEAYVLSRHDEYPPFSLT